MSFHRAITNTLSFCMFPFSKYGSSSEALIHVSLDGLEVQVVTPITVTVSELDASPKWPLVQMA